MVYCVKDVDQTTGEDLNPNVNRMLGGGEVRDQVRNPDRPTHMAPAIEEDGKGSGRGTTRMTSPEKWEIKQVIKFFLSIRLYFANSANSCRGAGEVRLPWF